MNKMNILLVISFLFGATFVYAQPENKYAIAKVFHVSGGGGYDYTTVDTASDRLYVSHGTQVNVINKLTGDSIGVITSDKDVHGIALVHDLGKGYISNGSLNSVLVFDLATFRVLAHVPTGQFSDGIFYDDFSKKIISCNGRSKNITVIDPVTDKPVATVMLTGWPESAVSDGAGKIYVNNAEKAEIDVIDAQTFKITNRWPNTPGTGASGLAIDRVTKRLFAGCENKMLIVMDATNGKVVANVPTGDGCDAVTFDPKTKTIYSSNGEGTLTIIKELPQDKFIVRQNLSTKSGARTMALDQTTHRLYLPTGEFAPKKAGEFRPSLIPGSFQVLLVSQ